MTDLRRLTPEDDPALARLEAEAFFGGRRSEPSAPDLEKPRSTVLGICDGPRLVAAATVHDLHLWWGEREVPMGGIAGVACAADQRGRGHVGRLLTESLRVMRDAGQYTSGLYPFAYAFYRRFGWEWAGERREYSVPTAHIPASPEGRAVRCYDGPEALDIVRPVYDTFARRHRGMATRTNPDPNFWERALAHADNRSTYVQVYHDPATDKAEGYLTFRYPESGETGQVGEFFANTPAAYRGLLSLLHYYGTQMERVKFFAPANDPLPLFVMHSDLETKVSPLFMGRVVDVAQALSALTPDPSLAGTLSLGVSDPTCDWNDGAFAVTVEAGQVSAVPTPNTPGITLDIQALTQAYWGQPALPLLRAAGRVSVTDAAQYELLFRLLPPAICFLADGF